MQHASDLDTVLDLQRMAQEIANDCGFGACCAFVGMGCRGRIRRLTRLLISGEITAGFAMEQAEEARRIAYSVRSLAGWPP